VVIARVDLDERKIDFEMDKSQPENQRTDVEASRAARKNLIEGSKKAGAGAAKQGRAPRSKGGAKASEGRKPADKSSTGSGPRAPRAPRAPRKRKT
jgi:ribonuclease R